MTGLITENNMTYGYILSSMAKPILKWPGGKRDLVDEILGHFPSDYDTYHEPFVGAGALFFHIEPKNGFINDSNTRLINYYKQVRDNPDELIDMLRDFEDPESDANPSNRFSSTNRKGRDIESYYYQVRELFNRRPNNESFDEVEEAAQLQYLNRTCFNGLYRENNSGEFNSPIGSYDNPDWVLETRIREASEALEGTNILNKDFEYILETVDDNDVVYLDPPYKPTSKTASFTEYSEGGFGEDEQMRLLETVKELDDRGVRFILSNSAIMYDDYNDLFEVEYVMGDRSISCKADGRGEVKEILVHNT